MTIHPTYGEKTINELSLLFQHRQINLDPGFQRKSVWSSSDRRRLIQSIVAGYPVPSIFLYRRESRGRPVYDVLDGKQRLETIYMFTGLGRFKRQAFEVRLDLENGVQALDWKLVRKKYPNIRAAIETYKIQAVELTGDLKDMIDLFVRINSTGKRLTSGEKRHAKFYNSAFLRQAEQLVHRYSAFLKKMRVLNVAQIDRMKGTELFSELLMSINSGGPINKKTSLDRAIGNDSVNGNTLSKITREFKRTIRLVGRLFPELSKVRFHNSAEFYSLFMVVWEMERENFILGDKRRNRIAFELLRKLSNGVDLLREQLRRARPAKESQQLFADYLLTVQGDTDSSANRERRQKILKGLLWTVFERKDNQRAFSTEQRRLLWNTDENPKCARCHKPLDWNDVTVDHIKAWSRGGLTNLRNAQLMHRHCNSSKGAR